MMAPGFLKSSLMASANEELLGIAVLSVALYEKRATWLLARNYRGVN